MTEKLYTVQQIAARFGVHADTVRRWIEIGALKALHVGPGARPRVRIAEAEAAKLVRKG